MDEQEERGVSIADICRIIFSQKLLAVILLVVITVVGTVGIYFVYTKPDRVYSVTFNLMEPYNSVVTSYSVAYPDGTKFFLYEYTSYGTLKNVIASDEEFSYLDVDDMCDDDAVTYSEGLDTDGTISDITLSVKAKYFSGESDAFKFLSALAEYPIDGLLSVSVNYNRYLTESVYKSAITYAQQVNYFDSQLTYMIENLEGLDEYMSKDGQLVSDISVNLENLKASIDFEALLTEIEANNYVKDYETQIAKYIDALRSLDKQIYDAKKNLDYFVEKMSLSSGGAYGGDLGSTLSTLKSTLTKLERERSDILSNVNAYYSVEVSEEPDEYGMYTYTLSDTVNETQVKNTEAFETKLDEIYQTFVSDDGYIAQFSELMTYLRANNSGVTFVGNITLSGGMSMALTVAISFVLGLIVACIVAYIVGAQKLRKAEQSAAPLPVFTDAQAEAAPADDDKNGEE